MRRETDQALQRRAEEVKGLEGSIAQLLRRQHCDLLDLKAMKPTGFNGDRSERWTHWARKTKAYCNAKHPGFRAALT